MEDQQGKVLASQELNKASLDETNAKRRKGFRCLLFECSTHPCSSLAQTHTHRYHQLPPQRCFTTIGILAVSAMSIEVWIDQVSSTHVDSIPSWLTLPDNDKENTFYLPRGNTKKRVRFSPPMDGTYQDAELTPRPAKKRRQNQPDLDPPEHFSSVSARSDDNTSELESHHSGRISPTKQLAFLEDSSEPVIYCDFATTTADVPGDVSTLCDAVQALADGVAILGFTPDELAGLTSPNTALDHRDRKRFGYAWANNCTERLQTGTMVPLKQVQGLVSSAIAHEDNRDHETVWNEDVHKTVIAAALTASMYAEHLGIANVKSASVDPPELAYQKLPKRVVDYAIVLRPSQPIQKAWEALQTVGNAGIKSWNHSTSNGVRSTPIASNIETKAPGKSWTDGKAQVAIWTAALFKRLALLKQPGQGRLDIPAMPLLISQGHDWHFFVVSQQSNPASKKRTTTIWQKIDIGNTRNCFDAYKLIAVLHRVMEWAFKVWRPWFHDLIRWMVVE
ncbi:MAG: hypothetical protein Q9209_006171 [Squamulea sp. 1 TL-2023]